MSNGGVLIRHIDAEQHKTTDLPFFKKMTDQFCLHFPKAYTESVTMQHISDGDRVFCNETYQPPVISNICGSFAHLSKLQSVNKNLWPLFSRCKHVFGEFYGLYHLDCNIITSGQHNTSLFRAGRNSVKIIDVIQTAMYADTISKILLHMLVCSAHLMHPVKICNRDGKFLDLVFLDNSNWEAFVDYSNEDLSSVKAIRIKNFSRDFLSSVIPAHCHSIKAFLINISYTGFINLFLTINEETIFTPGIEKEFLPLFRYFFDLIQSSC